MGSGPRSGGSIDEVIARVLARFPEIAAAWLFGSVARGEARHDSDVDIGLVFQRRGDTALDHHRVIGDIASRLEAVLPHRVDLVVLQSQGPVFCHRAISEGRLVYEASRARRIDFESGTYSRYLDYRPTWEIAARCGVSGLRNWLEARR